ncbi:riboflavin synthase [Haloarculaceae archaeon H-GB2-1]|nr:riboflavin synthase [Haloarculaceae archaeon H-GB1-1]MEA5388852.1 riboflavin synthase [Haloarculaceae archaeon H-GB11]MEA5406909.1 riboflavin synthase [Haloarculaceae archaeon H-GB2-1]
MFTGIVEETGEVLAVEDDEGGRRLRIATTFGDMEHGQSISVDGACLTVEEHEQGEWFSVFLATETIDRTGFADVAEGDSVNLERGLAADGRFDGHVVQGHVDGTVELLETERHGEDWTFTFSLPDDLAPYVVEKGFVALDGISLTVADVTDDTFSIAVIPTTYEETVLREREPGDSINLEVDVVAKYVESLHAE